MNIGDIRRQATDQNTYINKSRLTFQNTVILRSYSLTMSISANNAAAAFKSLCHVVSEKAKKLKLYKNSVAQLDSEGKDKTCSLIGNTLTETSGREAIQK